MSPTIIFRNTRFLWLFSEIKFANGSESVAEFRENKKDMQKIAKCLVFLAKFRVNLFREKILYKLCEKSNISWEYWLLVYQLKSIQACHVNWILCIYIPEIIWECWLLEYQSKSAQAHIATSVPNRAAVRTPCHPGQQQILHF